MRFGILHIFYKAINQAQRNASRQKLKSTAVRLNRRDVTGSVYICIIFFCLSQKLSFFIYIKFQQLRETPCNWQKTNLIVPHSSYFVNCLMYSFKKQYQWRNGNAAVHPIHNSITPRQQDGFWYRSFHCRHRLVPWEEI